jgi:DNA invertase Pin-like site-specific DNA recombinase
MNNNYNVALYLRLSIEDGLNTSKRGKNNPFQDESTSIDNQRAMLTAYAELQGWNVVKSYADDGYSGGNFNRPAFHEMVRDAEYGAINLVLCRDLSRLGRDYIEVGRYTDEVFPALGVRFIALMDDIDSEGNTDLLPFRAILNDYHLKDLSRKVKTVFQAKAEKGEYIGANAPYGFVKDPSCRTRLLVDEYAAGIVRRIFDMRVQGYGYGKIAAALNNEEVLSPKTYSLQKSGKERPAKAWIAAVVKLILTNESYIGNSVKFKTGCVSYKNRLQVRKPEEQWIRCDNVYPQIISREIWDEAQRLGKERGIHTALNPEQSLFGGLLRCADCGGAMTRKFTYYTSRITGEKKRYSHYACAKNGHSGGSVCSKHSIAEHALLDIIRGDVRKQLETVDIDKNAVMREIQKQVRFNSLDEAKTQHGQLAVRLGELELVSKKLYEDRLRGIISVEMFTSLYEQSKAELTEAKTEYERLSDVLTAASNLATSAERIIPLMREFLTLETVTHDTLAALIDHMAVGKCEKRNGEKVYDVKIIYRFGAGQTRKSTNK